MATIRTLRGKWQAMVRHKGIAPPDHRLDVGQRINYSFGGIP